MQRRKSQVSVELSHAPLSKRDDNKAPASARIDRKMPKARPSQVMVSVEIPVKGSSSSKPKNRAHDQNVEPTPEAENRTLKRKRSASDLTKNNGVKETKKRVAERGQFSKEPSIRDKPAAIVATLPQPKWIPVPTEISYDDIMQRMQLREFLARFQPLTKLAQVHLDILSRMSVPIHQYIPKATLKAVLLVLVDLVGADAAPTIRQECQTTLRYIRNAKGDLGVTWDALSGLRRTCYSEIPSPDNPPTIDIGADGESEGESEEQVRVTRRASRLARASLPSPPPKDDTLDYPLICGGQFLPILVFLAELALQTPSVRADIDHGLRTLSIVAHKTHATKLAEEKSRWSDERQKFTTMLAELQSIRSQEVEAANAQGTHARRSPTTTKIKELKSKRKLAEANHQRIVRKLSVAYNLELRACAGRGTCLGSDQSSRQYFALSLAPKSTHSEGRWNYWSTFVACWGAKAAGMQPSWYGFDDPSELRLLAGTLEHSIEQGSTSTKDKDPLVRSLLAYADFLDDRIKD